MNDFWEQKLIGNVRVNEPIGIFKEKTDSNQLWPEPAQFFFKNLDLEEHHKHLDVVELKFARHDLLKTISDYEITFIVRNRLSHNIPFKSNITELKIFKNDHIGVLKKGHNKKYVNKCNSNWEILKEDKYPLQTLEADYISTSEVIDDPLALKPYEMAEYRFLSQKNYDEVRKKADQLTISDENVNKWESLLMTKAIKKLPTEEKSKPNLLIPFLMVTLLIFILIIGCKAFWKKKKNPNKYQIEMDEMPAPGARDSNVEDNQI